MKFSVLRGNRNLLFWGLHTTGWIAYGLALYLGSAIYVKDPGYDPGYDKVIVIATVSGWLLSAPLR